MRTYAIKIFGTILVNICFLSSLSSSALPDFTTLAEESSPAVVNIMSTKQVSNSNFNRFGNRDFNGPQYDEFFRRFFGDLDRAPQKKRNVSSTGSGFIISDDGFILTNSHVVNGADEIKVSLSDRTEYIATLVGLDERADVALLKIDASKLPKVTIGTSNNLKVGEWVVAIGSPFQLNFSVTAGIVSAKGRSIPNGSDTTYVPFIQTDVAINPGNSGGPLFNLSGEVVGINSQIYTRSGGYMGVSFSIPIDYAMDIADQIKDKGYVSRGWLGVSIQEVTSELADALGMPVPKGALISQIIEGSPAEKAGLQEEDVILIFDGEEIFYSADLPQTVGSIRPGSKIKASVLRGGIKKTIVVEVGELPKDPKIDPLSSSLKENLLGLVIEDQNLRSDKDSKYIEGVLVTGIDQEGLAAEGGILKGDIIWSLGRIRISSVKDFNSTMNTFSEDQNITIGIARNGIRRILSLKLTK